MKRFRAAFVLPMIGPPLRGAWVGVEDGRIAALGTGGDDVVDLGHVAVLPGLVNAHTHLELSYLAGQVGPTTSFGPWVRAVLALRQQRVPETVVRRAALGALEQARRAGTAVLGEVTNTLVTVPLLAASDMPAHVFYELTGFTEAEPAARAVAARTALDEVGVHPTIRASLAPHAPYSVSADFFVAIRHDLDERTGTVSSVHLGEHDAELALLRDGTGDMRALLEELGRWPEGWEPPRKSPVEYLRDLGVLDSRMLAVHGVQLTGDDLDVLRTLGTTLVSCPRSNVHVGSGAPPLEAFYAMDVRVAFGTDSLASAPDLNLFNELAEARRVAPRVPARQLLRSATLVGAQALGFGDDYGSIEVGKRAALLTVRVPEGVVDVEEYLVGGLSPDAVSWLDV